MQGFRDRDEGMRIQNPMHENTVARGPAAARADLQPEESALISRIIAKRLTYLPEIATCQSAENYPID
jgi:hypothetical protein